MGKEHVSSANAKNPHGCCLVPLSLSSWMARRLADQLERAATDTHPISRRRVLIWRETGALLSEASVQVSLRAKTGGLLSWSDFQIDDCLTVC